MATNDTAAQALPAVRALDGDRLIFVEDLAQIIGRSPSAVRYMVSRGQAPRSAKIAGRRMFRMSDVNAWLQAAFDAEDAA